MSSSSSSSSAASAAPSVGSVVSDKLLRVARAAMQRDAPVAPDPASPFAPAAAAGAASSAHPPPPRAPCGCKGVKARRQQFIEQNCFPRGASVASALPLTAPSAGSQPAAGKNCAHCRSPLSDLCIMCDTSHHAPASTLPARPPLFTDDGEGGGMSDDDEEYATHGGHSGAMGAESPQPPAASTDCTLVQGACGHSFHSHCFKTWFVQSHKNQCVTCLAAWNFASPDSEPVPIFAPATAQGSGSGSKPAAESKESVEKNSKPISAPIPPLFLHVLIPPLGIRSIRVAGDVTLSEAIGMLTSDATIAAAIRALEIPVAGAETKSAWKPLLMMGDRVLCTLDVAVPVPHASDAKDQRSASKMDQSDLRALPSPSPPPSAASVPALLPATSEGADNLKIVVSKGLECSGLGGGLCSMFFQSSGEAHAVLAVCSPRVHPTPLQLAASSCRAVPPTAQEKGAEPATFAATTLTKRSHLQSIIREKLGALPATQRLWLQKEGGAAKSDAEGDKDMASAAPEAAAANADWRTLEGGDSSTLLDIGCANASHLWSTSDAATRLVEDQFDGLGMVVPEIDASAEWLASMPATLGSLPRQWVAWRHVRRSLSDREARIAGWKTGEAAGFSDMLSHSLAWQPVILQSDRAMSSFLSCLYVFAQSLSNKEERASRTLGFMRGLGLSAPAILGFQLLITGKLAQFSDAYKSAISNGILDLLHRCIVLRTGSKSASDVGMIDEDDDKMADAVGASAAGGPANPGGVELDRLFEHARPLLSFFLQHAKVEHAATEEYTSLAFEAPPPPAKGKPAPAPELPPDSVLPNAREVREKLVPMLSNAPGLKTPEEIVLWTPPVTAVQEAQKSHAAASAPTSAASASASSSALEAAALAAAEALASANLLQWKRMVQEAGNESCMRVIAAASVAAAPKPSITRDADGRLAVSTSRPKGAETEATLFRPLYGQEETFRISDLKNALARLSKSDGSMLEDEESTFVDQRTPEEAILVLMDLSNSMDRPAGLKVKKSAEASKGKKEKVWKDYDNSEDEEEDDDDASGGEELSDEEDDDDDDDEEEAALLRKFPQDADLPMPAKLEPINPFAKAAQLKDEDKAAILRTVAWIRSHPNLREWRQAMGSAFGFDSSALDAMLKYENNYLPSHRGHVATICRFRPFFVPLFLDRPDHAIVVELEAEVATAKHLRKKSRLESAAAAAAAKSGAGGAGAASSGSSSNNSSPSNKHGHKHAREVEDADEDVAPAESDDSIPDEFLCPITYELMVDPTTCSDGHTYERQALERWFENCPRGKKTSPLTGLPLPQGVKPQTNFALKSLIAKFHAERARKKEAERMELMAMDAAENARMAARCGKQAAAGGSASSSGSAAMMDESSMASVAASDNQVSVSVNVDWGPRLQLGRFHPDRTSVLQLRYRLALDHGVPLKKQTQLALQWGRHLEDQMSLTEAGLKGSVNLEMRTNSPASSGGMLSGRARGGRLAGLVSSDAHFDRAARVPIDFEVELSYLGQTHRLACVPGEPIYSLKYRLQQVVGRSANQFSLWVGLKKQGDGVRCGSVLQDHTTLSIPYQFMARGGNAGAQASAFTVTVLNRRRPPDLDEEYQKRHDQILTRLQASKQLFEAFVNRSIAYQFPAHIGLMTFSDSDKIKLSGEISASYEAFRKNVERMHAEGDTALLDALSEGTQALLNWQQKGAKGERKNARLRILVLSDGADTGSSREAHTVAAELQRHNITVDAIQLGAGGRDATLQALSRVTGGLCFAPASLKSALQLCEHETVLSVTERPARKAALTPIRSSYAFSQALRAAKPEPSSEDDFPARKQTFNTGAKVQGLEQAISKAQALIAGAPVPGTAPASGSGSAANASVAPPLSAAQSKRIFRELRNLLANPHPAFDVYPTSDDLRDWILICEGPSGSIYVGGCWRLTLHFPSGYPAVAPEIRFDTRIMHVNISVYGKVCHSMVGGSAYTQDVTVRRLLDCIYGLLLSPQIDDPLNSNLALLYYEGDGTYEARVTTAVKKYASKSRADWKKQLMDEEAGAEAASSAATPPKPKPQTPAETVVQAK